MDEVHLSVGFAHGAAQTPANSAFFIDDLSLVPLPEPAAGAVSTAAQAGAIVPKGELLSLGGRWFYAAQPGEKTPPKVFNTANADRLLYHDDIYSAPFAGNTFAWLRAGNLKRRRQRGKKKTAFLRDKRPQLPLMATQWK